VVLVLLFAFAFPSSPRALDLSQEKIREARSLRELEDSFARLKAHHLSSKKARVLSFPLQQEILSLSGEVTSRLAELIHREGRVPKEKEAQAKDLLEANLAIILDVYQSNHEKIRYYEEEVLDDLDDPEPFFESPEWQEPQKLVSTALYWLSWSRYYLSFFYAEDSEKRKGLLEESIDGFSRTAVDARGPKVAARSLLGRALCYKELKDFERALRDLELTVEKNPGPFLIFRAHYEQALVLYLAKRYTEALERVDEILGEAPAQTETSEFLDGLKGLQIKISLALAEEKSPARRQKDLKRSLSLVRDLAERDPYWAREMYQLTLDHAEEFKTYPPSELGPIGELALGDHFYNEKGFGEAASRYLRALSSSSPQINQRKDDLYFRLGVCFSQLKQWEEAASYLVKIFEDYPGSSFTPEASCLYYICATTLYQESPTGDLRKRYLAAAQTYLKDCPDQKGKSDARFQLGQHFLETGKRQRAMEELSKVGKDSTHHATARYWVLQSRQEELERLKRTGKISSKKGKALHKQALADLEAFKSALQTDRADEAQKLRGPATYVEAKIYASGPSQQCGKALDLLGNFEEEFSNQRDLFLPAKTLRMQCYQRLHKFSRALEESQEFLQRPRLDRGSWTFLNESASGLYRQAQRLEGSRDPNSARFARNVAIAIYKRLVREARGNSSYGKYLDELEHRLGELYLAHSDYAGATALCQVRLQRNPQSVDALTQLAVASEKAGHLQEALETYRALSQELAEESDLWLNAKVKVAELRHRLGEEEEACELLRLIKLLYLEPKGAQLKEDVLKLEQRLCGSREG
jgi:tetratricopeptide (TPR) repeat protein